MKRTPKFKCPLCGPEHKQFADEKAFSMHCHSKGGEHLAPDLKPAEVTAADRAAANENEVTEMWRAHHADQAKKRAENRISSSEVLRKAGVPFVVKNNGAHLILDERVDFWPGTSLWHCRITPTKGRGIRRLFDFLGVPFPAQQGTMSRPEATPIAPGP